MSRPAFTVGAAVVPSSTRGSSATTVSFVADVDTVVDNWTASEVSRPSGVRKRLRAAARSYWYNIPTMDEFELSLKCFKLGMDEE